MKVETVGVSAGGGGEVRLNKGGLQDGYFSVAALLVAAVRRKANGG